jgi:hypothetical protein
MGEDYSPPAEPIDWFLKAQQPGVHIIAPPAAAAVHALKEVAWGRHKCPRHVTYVILIPRLYCTRRNGNLDFRKNAMFGLL